MGLTFCATLYAVARCIVVFYNLQQRSGEVKVKVTARMPRLDDNKCENERTDRRTDK